MKQFLFTFISFLLLSIISGCNNNNGQAAPEETDSRVVRPLSVNQKENQNISEEILTTTKLRHLPKMNETDTIRATGKVREFKLEAKEGRWELVSGVETDANTFNGTVPGPTIRAKEGDTIRVILKNSLKEETSIHWHGLHVPNKMDGVPSFTQNAIKPGETFTYEFLANHAGTYMYHSHFNSIQQIDKGLYGLLIIDPQKETKGLHYDKEYTMLFGGWNIPDEAGGKQDGNENDGMAGMSKGEPEPIKRKGNVRSMMEHGSKDKDNQQTEMNGMDMPSENPGDNAGSSVMGMNYNYWTINGKSFPDTDPIEVKNGDLVHIRLANISNGIHPMHMHGHDFRIVAKDGHPLSEPQIVNTVTVNPGETYDIDFIADNPGEWVFHCHELHHTTNAEVEPGGLIALIKYVK